MAQIVCVLVPGSLANPMIIAEVCGTSSMRSFPLITSLITNSMIRTRVRECIACMQVPGLITNPMFAGLPGDEDGSLGVPRAAMGARAQPAPTPPSLDHQPSSTARRLAEHRASVATAQSASNRVGGRDGGLGAGARGFRGRLGVLDMRSSSSSSSSGGSDYGSLDDDSSDGLLHSSTRGSEGPLRRAGGLGQEHGANGSGMRAGSLGLGGARLQRAAESGSSVHTSTLRNFIHSHSQRGEGGIGRGSSSSGGRSIISDWDGRCARQLYACSFTTTKGWRLAATAWGSTDVPGMTVWCQPRKQM
eukprot:scaffold174834_cov17-Tisochrysis_lutea.AAC.1